MSGRLQGKVAIVTGAAGGIGAATAAAMRAQGAIVIATDVRDSPDGAWQVQDVADEAGWMGLVDQVVASHGRLDVLVNNAGVLLGQTIEDTTLDQWNRTLAVNLTGPMLGCKHAIRAMKANPGGPSGSIVNISSINGYIGQAMAAGYTASKGGVRLLTKSVAVHCARAYGTIRCNSVHPGAIDTPMVQAAFARAPDATAMRAFFDTLQPVGRMGTPDEIAALCVFLASEEASFVTGAEFVADGGWLAAGGRL
jgi:3(or 17)beta-hydroxysteroid dehydrogenase